MTELQGLTTQRDELLAKIREIEENCEGIENENNAARVQELNLQQAKLTAQKNEVSAQLSSLQAQLVSITDEINTLSGTGIDRILDAIKEQRWYFFKNKTKIMFDKMTGLLFPNLQYYNIGQGGIWGKYTGHYNYNSDIKFLDSLEIDDIKKWELPDFNDIKTILNDNSFPFYYKDSPDTNHSISNNLGTGDYFAYLRVSNGNNSVKIETSNSNFQYYDNKYYTCQFGILPKSEVLINDSDYENNISPDNPNYTEKEKLQFTLDIFVQNKLLPIFNDEEITELYKKIYFEKPQLLEQLQEIQTQIEKLQTVTLLSSEFDYTALLSKYDIKAIDNSVIKYYEAVQQWTNELLDKIDYYEKEKETIIRDFNLISLQLSKKYEDSPSLSQQENRLLEQRQKFFQKKFSLGMNSIKAKILAVKKQADDLEDRIDEIDNGENAIVELAVLEKEERAGFSFIAENTAKIIRNALKKIEYFEANHQFVMNAIKIWANWSEDYRVFKTTYKEDLKSDCSDDGIEEEIWTKWYEDWQNLRYNIELKIQPLIERGLNEEFSVEKADEITVPEQIIAELELYKNNIDKFFLEERKGIYQKFAFQAGGDLQDKFEAESSLYKYTVQFQTALQNIIFNCVKSQDRIFILNWANSLSDIQIDEILSFVADNDLQKISKTILEEFATLKQKNYDAYLTDAQAYSQEKAEREKQYNSLMFKMRKDLTK